MNTGFNWIDWTVLVGYLVFVLMIASIFVKEQNDLNDFFMASKKMPWWAVGCSILATLLSSVSITGMPAEFWITGFRTFGSFLVVLAMVPLVIILFVKIYVPLNLTTAYEYLEKRFSLTVRLFSSALFLLYRGTYIGTVLYASAILLHPCFSGRISIPWLIVGLGVLSCALAWLGGMKAIIWTDVIQLVVLYSGITWIVVSLINRIDGGFMGMWEVATAHGKDFTYLKDPSFWSFDLFEKTTFWGILLLYIFTELAIGGTDQLTVQRYLTTVSIKESAWSLWVYGLLSVPIILILWLISMSIFVFYTQNPDLLQKDFQPDGLLPHYVATQVPHGVSGLFAAAIMAAVLSTVDSGLNCLATASMTDFQLRLGKRQLSNSENVLWARTWTLVWAAVTTGLALLIFYTARENIARTVGTVMGLFSGPLLGVFLLGVLTRRANTWGVCAGAALGLGLTLWANFFWTRLDPDGQVVHISFAWPIVIGTLSTWIFGYVFSLFFSCSSIDELRGLTYWTRETTHQGNLQG
jgi:SSS family solute:Na+ symporter